MNFKWATFILYLNDKKEESPLVAACKWREMRAASSFPWTWMDEWMDVADQDHLRGLLSSVIIYQVASFPWPALSPPPPPSLPLTLALYYCIIIFPNRKGIERIWLTVVCGNSTSARPPAACCPTYLLSYGTSLRESLSSRRLPSRADYLRRCKRRRCQQFFVGSRLE